MSLSDFSRRTGLTQRKAIYLCEKGLVLASEDRGGRGHHRVFSDENIVEYRLAELLLNWGLELRRVAAISGFVRGFFDRLRTSYPDAPVEMPRSLMEASTNKPARLVLLDSSEVMLEFTVRGRSAHTDVVKVALGGQVSGPVPFKQQLDEATAVLRIDLAKLRP